MIRVNPTDGRVEIAPFEAPDLLFVAALGVALIVLGIVAVFLGRRRR